MERDERVTLTVQGIELFGEMPKVAQSFPDGDFLAPADGFSHGACTVWKRRSQAHRAAFGQVTLLDAKQVRPQIDADRNRLGHAVDALWWPALVAGDLFFGDQAASFKLFQVLVDGRLTDVEQVRELHRIVRFSDQTFEDASTHVVLKQAKGCRRVVHLLNHWFNSRGLL